MVYSFEQVEPTMGTMNTCYQASQLIDTAIPERRLVLPDWEFTSFEEPKMLSIALVTYDGREIYVDLASDSHLNRASTLPSTRWRRCSGWCPTLRRRVSRLASASVRDYSSPASVHRHPLRFPRGHGSVGTKMNKLP